jgi:hypothetical protein
MNIITNYKKIIDEVYAINKKITFANGDGLHSTDPFIEEFIHNLPYEGTLDELTSRLIRDYIMFNGTAIQCMYSIFGTIIRINHIPFQDVRVKFPTIPNVVDGYYISNDWARYTWGQNVPTLLLPAIGKGKSYQESELIYSFEYDTNLRYYPIPKWFCATQDIYVEDQLGVNRANYIANNFTVNYMILLPNKPVGLNKDGKPEVLQSLLDDVIYNHTGAENAGKVTVLFGEPNKDGTSQMPQVVALGSSDRVNEYNEQNEIAKAKIITAHGVTSPVILGISGSATLGSNAQEIRTAYQMFMNTEIKPIQKYIIRQFEKILEKNNMASGTLYFKPLDILEGLQDSI